MKIELHILQNFAPSNLNRDDTGSPKDCELGGVRRARISSQCYKRAIRQAFDQHQLLHADERASRTKRIVHEVAELIGKKRKDPEEDRRRAVAKALELGDLKTDGKSDNTQYLIFLPTRSLQALADLVDAHFAALATPPAEEAAPAARGRGRRGAARHTAESDAGEGLSEVKAAVKKILEDGEKTPELALFGRMIADAPEWNVEAACQVAHAVSTHRVAMEFDFYTAVDDFKAEDNAGSSMMGTIPFNSACFYRYLVVDATDLTRNLGEGAEAKKQAERTVAALVRAAVLAIPTGKQNSMAAHNPPSIVYAEVTNGSAPRSLANAFVDPVRPGREGDLVSQSVLRLGAYAGALDKVYGSDKAALRTFLVVDPTEDLAKEFSKRVPKSKEADSLDGLVGSVTAAAFGGSA